MLYSSRHSTNRSTNQIAGKSLFSSENDIYVHFFFNDAVAKIFSSRQEALSLLQVKDIAMEICMISYNVD